MQPGSGPARAHLLKKSQGICQRRCPQAIIMGLLGGIAQLGERLHGMQEVSGSIPLTSTKNRSPVRLEA